MAVVSVPNVFSVGSTILASEHNANFNTIYDDYGGNISNANIANAAAITDGKLAQITTASKVSGAALTSLGSVPAGAGDIPSANMSTNACVLTGNQTVAGIKTFSSIPVLPSAPTSDDEAASKGYVDVIATFLDYGTSTSAYTAKSMKNIIYCYGTTGALGDNAQATITNLPFASAASYSITGCQETATASSDGAVSVSRTNGSTCVLTHQGAASSPIVWMAIGT